MGTENLNMDIRSYQKQFKEFLRAVFAVQSYFGDFFTGGLEALDGVQHNETAFYVKTSDIPVVVRDNYDKGANVAFGTGTSNSNRFGPRTEIIYTDTPVPYTWEWSYHEGIDRHTVNNAFDAAVAERLDLQAQAKVRLFNRHHSAFIANAAGRTEGLASYGADNVLALFNTMSAHFVNVEAQGTKVVKVRSDLYNAIVDHPLVTTGKHSAVNIDQNGIVSFKGFLIQEIPDELLTVGANNYAAYAYITNMAKAFTGITTARAIASEDFDGMALQGAGKAGEFIQDDNKKAIIKVAAPVVP